MARWVSIAIAAAVLVVGAIASADEKPGAAKSAIDGEVQKHFDYGNAAYQEGRYADALIEYEEAYKRSKNWKILFNRGQCLVMLRREPEAIEVFEKYLADGGDEVPEERRAQVKTDIAQLEGRLAWVTVDAKGKGWEILVDGRVVGTTPLPGPIPIGMGLHELGARRPQSTGPGYTKQLRLVAGARLTETVDLPPEPEHVAPPKPEATTPLGLPSPAFNVSLLLGVSTPTTFFARGRLDVLGAVEIGGSWRPYTLFEFGAFLGAAGGQYALNGDTASGARVEPKGDYAYAMGGVRARLHVLRDRYVDGWIGGDLAAWREQWKFTGASSGNDSFQYVATSPLFAGSAGIDFPIHPSLAIGGMARLSVSSAQKGTRVECNANCAGDLPGTNGGARAFFDFGARLVWILPYERN